MDKASPDDRGREGRLNNLIAEHLEAVEAGRPPDREAWLAQGPDLADDLRAFLAAHDQMAQVGAPLRALASAQPPVSESPNLAPGETPVQGVVCFCSQIRPAPCARYSPRRKPTLNRRKRRQRRARRQPDAAARQGTENLDVVNDGLRVSPLKAIAENG
jgi:hypothetical protein